MILPGRQNFEGRIGTTWDQEFRVYPSTYGFVKFNQEDAAWATTKDYVLNDGVVGSDGHAYYALKENLNKNPVGGEAGNWEKMIPLDITGYTGEFKSGEMILKSGSGITIVGAEGLVKLKAKPEQTKIFKQEKVHYAFLMVDTQENLYEYGEGKINWKAQ